MKCHNCGKENPDDYKFCLECGAARQEEPEQKQPETVAQPAAEPAQEKKPELTEDDRGDGQGGQAALAKPGKKKPWLVIGVVLLLAISMFAAYYFIFSDLSLGGGNHIMLALPDDDGTFDLSLLRYRDDQDDGLEIAEEIQEASIWFYDVTDGLTTQQIGDRRFGGFIPGSNEILYWYQDDEIVLNRMNVRGSKSVEIMDSRTDFLTGNIVNDRDDLFILEWRDDQVYCYLAQAGEEADRVEKGDYCWLSLTGKRLFVSDERRGETTILAMDIDGENEIRILDDKENVTDWRASDDGSALVYVKEDGTKELILVETTDGEEIAASDEHYEISHFAFLNNSSTLYYVAETETGEMELYLLDESGPNLLKSGFSIRPVSSREGKQLAYLVEDEDGTRTLSIREIRSGETREITSADNLQVAQVPESDTFIVVERDEDDLTISGVPANGTEMLELFSDDDYELSWMQYIPDFEYLFIELLDREGLQSLFVASLTKDENYQLLDEWYSFELMNISRQNDILVFAGREDQDDELALYSLQVEEDARPEELDDDADEFLNAVFDPSSSTVLYSVVSGDDPDDRDVRSVPADGSDRHDRLYRESVLVDVQWDQLRPFNQVYIYEMIYGTSYCPGAPRLAVDETPEVEINGDEEVCYQLLVDESDLYTMYVEGEGDLDTMMALYDREGNRLDFSDDDRGDSVNPLLRLSLDEDQVYFLTLQGYQESESGTVELFYLQGTSDPFFDRAQSMDIGDTVSGAITSESMDYSFNFDVEITGDVYVFEGDEGDDLTIDILADSIGSDFDPTLILLDSTLEVLDSDEDSGAGFDARLITTLPENGTYYILVYSMYDDYGTAGDYFYELSITRGVAESESDVIFEGEIACGDTVSGQFPTDGEDHWSFTGEYGMNVTISLSDTDGELDTYLDLYAQNGDRLLSDDDGGPGADSEINFFLQDSDTYTIAAKGCDGEGGSYELSVSCAESNSIDDGETVTGRVTNSTGDSWIFRADRGDRVDIYLDGGGDLDAYLELIGPDGSEIASNDDGGSGRDSYISNFELPSTGVYVIIARGYNGDEGSYSLTMEMD